MKTIRLNKNIESFLCMFALFCTFLPAGLLDQLAVSDVLSNLLEYSSLILYIVIILFHSRGLALNKAIYFSILIMLIEVTTTLLSGGNVYKAIFETAKFVLILIVIYNECYHLNRYIVKYVVILCIAYGLISGVFSLMNPFTISIFGVRTEISNYIIPIVAILIMEFCNMSFMMKILSVITIGLSIISVYFYIDVSTAKVALLLVILMCSLDNFCKKISPFFLVSFFCVLNLGIVVFRLNEYLGFFIEGILKESITLHKRTFAWDFAFDLIKQSPILGYGYIDKQYQYSILYKISNGWFSHPHNEFLRLYLVGGLFNIFAISGLIISTTRTLKKYYYNKKIRMITYSLFTMLIISIDETCFDSFFYVVLAFAISSEYFIKFDETESPAFL